MRLPFNEIGKATGEPLMGEGEIKILVSVVLSLRYLLDIQEKRYRIDGWIYKR